MKSQAESLLNFPPAAGPLRTAVRLAALVPQDPVGGPGPAAQEAARQVRPGHLPLPRRHVSHSTLVRLMRFKGFRRRERGRVRRLGSLKSDTSISCFFQLRLRYMKGALKRLKCMIKLGGLLFEIGLEVFNASLLI